MTNRPLEAIREYVSAGCSDMSNSLGIQQMPDGYALMLNPDKTHYFWITKNSESCIHCDKWAVYRGAKEHAK